MKRETHGAAGLCLTAAAATAVAVWIAWGRGLAWGHSFAENARFLSDGCFVVGLWLTGLGGLIWVSTTGFFDIMAYSIRYGLHALVGLLIPQKRTPGMSFYDYKLEREEKRRAPRYGLLLTGVALVVLSALFLWVYYWG